MLELHFINVGDGDAALIEDREGDKVFRLLVDAGNRGVDPVPGSMRLTAGEYLRARGVRHIDALVVTHLHSDHFCGLEGMEEVTFGRVYSGFFPPCPGRRVREDPGEGKALRGMSECLNWWAQRTERLAAGGAELIPVEGEARGLRLTGRLTMDLRCDRPDLCAVQRQIWTELLRGAPVEDWRRYWASKYRNAGSLRATLSYAGRRIELPGDCPGSVWEGSAAPCDILKTPHHGERGALTPELVERLRPAWAVISCAGEYVPRKDRPSARVLELLRGCGAQVWFTDCYPEPGREIRRWDGVDFTIAEDGRVLTPDSRAGGGRECL